MKIIYDPTVDALSIRLVEEPMEYETIRLNDQVAVDIGPKEQTVAIEVLDVSWLRTSGCSWKTLQSRQGMHDMWL